MDKKKICTLFILGMSVASCVKENPKEEMKIDNYSDLYKTTYTESFEAKTYLTNKALYGYTKNRMQGYNGWSYLCSTDGLNNLQMTFNTEKERFENGSAYIKNDVCFSTSQISVIREYTSDINGDAVIYGNPKCVSDASNGGTIKVLLNGNLLKSYTISNGDTIGKYIEINTPLVRSDRVDFVLEGNNAEISFSPVITLENSQNTSLYHKNDYGHQYGDVFPWYDEENHQLYMWYLWSENCLAPVPNPYSYAIDLSSNLIKMKTYEEANNYNLYNRYKQNYRYNQLFDVNRFIDQSKYPVGVRDNMLYFDKENDRYLLIAGCYREFGAKWDSDLMIFESKDKFALEWDRVGNPVHKDYTSNLPECPSLLKIGKRWFPMVSVSHVTKHQIGGLRYWMGNENVDCIDENWTNKNEYWLDGEDLCAARPTQVGDKVYMWGWITASYNNVPFSPWAGYLNLPREVVQREDGTLGGRMDPACVKYLTFGNMVKHDSIETDSQGTNLINKVTRTFATYELDLSNSNSASFVYTQGNHKVMCSLEKENGKVFMKVKTPTDSSHPVNSSLEIYNPSLDGKYKIKIVNDGGIIEFFANEDNALTAKTIMDNSPYSISVEASSSAVFSNIMINKLRSYSDAD